MSRTDAHAPFAVRVARREVADRPVPRCAGSVCDLPDVVPGWEPRRGAACYWQWFFAGHGICPCWMCHWHRRPEVQRATVRAELRGQVREWNAGFPGPLPCLEASR